MRQLQYIGLLYGWIVIFGLILISSICLALLLKFSTLSEPTLSWVTLIVGLVSLFIGGLVAGLKGKAKGWLIGGLTGAGFTLFTFLVQYLGYKQGFSLEQNLHHAGFILAALVGGVIGVNFVSESDS